MGWRARDERGATPGEATPGEATATRVPAAPLPALTAAGNARVARMLAPPTSGPALRPGILPQAVLARRREREPEGARPLEPAHQDTSRRMGDHELLEVIAKDYAYRDDLDAEATTFLRSQGLRVGSRMDTGLSSVEAVSFVATDRRRRSIVAFRGSEMNQDWLYNLSSNNDPGVLQGILEAPAVARLVSGAARGGDVVLTGHSLGGAMAQLFAAGFYDLVAEVVTFNSPGIPELIAQYVEGQNRRARAQGGSGLRATHYRTDDDAVDDLGATFLPGTAVNYDIEGIDGPIDSHLAMVLNVRDSERHRVTRRGSERAGPGSGERRRTRLVDSAIDITRGRLPGGTRRARDRDAERFLERIRQVRASNR